MIMSKLLESLSTLIISVIAASVGVFILCGFWCAFKIIELFFNVN